MSYSSKIKKETGEYLSKARHCRIAELAALYTGLNSQGRVKINFRNIIFKTENLTVANKSYILLKKVFHIIPDVIVRRHKGVKESYTYLIIVSEKHEVINIIKTLKIDDKSFKCDLRILTESDCCKKAFLRGAFLVAGSVTDPNKSYHLEFVSHDTKFIDIIKHIIESQKLDIRMTKRKNAQVLYIKEGSQISDFLKIIKAYKCMLEFENIRIVKGVRNNVNRGVNCETANITRVISAANRQKEDIELIMKLKGLNNLSPGLREVAEARLNNPDASLQELADYIGGNVGKSGVNHRLRRLSEIAKSLK